jgi:hypothetical protein
VKHEDYENRLLWHSSRSRWQRADLIGASSVSEVFIVVFLVSLEIMGFHLEASAAAACRLDLGEVVIEKGVLDGRESKVEIVSCKTRSHIDASTFYTDPTTGSTVKFSGIAPGQTT